MGTFGAFYHRNTLKLDELILYSPIVTLDPKFEVRWLNDYSSISLPKEALYPIEGYLDIGKYPVSLIYDPMDYDARHVSLLQGEQVNRVEIPGGGHAVANWLKEKHLLSVFGDALLFRNKSHTKLKEMVQRSDATFVIKLLHRNESHLSRQTTKILEKLTESYPTEIELLPELSICLARLKRHDESAKFLNNFAGQDIQAYYEPKFIMALFVYLHQGGDRNKVNGHIERVLQSKTTSLQMEFWSCRLLRYLGRFEDSKLVISPFDSAIPSITEELQNIEHRKHI